MDDKVPTAAERAARAKKRGNAEEALSTVIIYGKDGKPVFTGDNVVQQPFSPEELEAASSEDVVATGENYDPNL